MNTYEIWLCDQLGNREYNLTNLARLEYGRRLNEVTWCQLNMLDDSLFTFMQPDRRIEIWKSIDGGVSFLAGETCWLLRKWKRTTAQGVRRLMMWGASANYVLTSRIILYAAGTAQAKKSAKKPNVGLYEFVKENLGSDAITERDLSTYLSIPAVVGGGTNISKGAAWRELLEVLQEICETSAQNGEHLFFDVAYDADTKLFSFQTYADQRGTDHTTDSDSPVIFSEKFGNLDNIEEMFDYSTEATHAVALGKGEESNRAINEQSDATRIALSPFGRRERAKDAVGADTANDLADEGKSLLRAGLPAKIFSADLLDVGVTFDEDYTWGDRITLVDSEGTEYNCFVDSFTVTIEGGRETIKTTTKVIQ